MICNDFHSYDAIIPICAQLIPYFYNFPSYHVTRVTRVTRCSTKTYAMKQSICLILGGLMLFPNESLKTVC